MCLWVYLSMDVLSIYYGYLSPWFFGGVSMRNTFLAARTLSYVAKKTTDSDASQAEQPRTVSFMKISPVVFFFFSILKVKW